MTKLDQFLERKSIKKANVSRKTGISQSRLSVLSSNPKTKLNADELYLNALAIDIEPAPVFNEMCGHLIIKS